jgi:protein arginine kinase
MSLSSKTPDAWYTEDGPDSDVVLSSRVRLARNLSGFVFPIALKSDDAERVQSILFDAFTHLDKPETYQMVRMANIESLGKRILCERGVIDSDAGNEPWRGIILRSDGVVSATVNIEDHLRLAAFTPGLSLSSCCSTVSLIDGSVREHVQYSALADFGYLTSNLSNIGSGMKASVLVCLPGLCMGNLIDRVIREYLSQGFIVRGYYGSEAGTSLGCLYQISNSSAASVNIPAQIGQMEQATLKLIDLERRSRQDLASSSPTSLENNVFRAIVTAKYARFISLNEAVDLLQRIKLGLNLGLITGIANKDITALLYRIQTAHIGFLILSGSIIIEEDVKTEELRMDRLRAMVVQEVLKEADIRERR